MSLDASSKLMGSTLIETTRSRVALHFQTVLLGHVETMVVPHALTDTTLKTISATNATSKAAPSVRHATNAQSAKATFCRLSRRRSAASSKETASVILEIIRSHS